MLKPYICVVCEKVILEQPPEGIPAGATGVPSLISLFNKIIAVTTGNAQGVPQEIPPNTVVPKEWCVFSSWDAEPGDEYRRYVVRTQILYPDNAPFGLTATSPLAIERDRRSQNIVRILGFPIGQIGKYTIRTWVEENGQMVLEPIDIKVEVEVHRQPQLTP
jgi:hypothetical protein